MIAPHTLPLLLWLIPTALPAWEFSADPICTITHAEGDVTAKITFDPATGTYALRLMRPAGWIDAPIFTIRFIETVPRTISTDRHIIDRTVLTVLDRGFGNVLSGLENGGMAVATLGDIEVRLDLANAAVPVAAFRSCPAMPAV